MTKAARRPSSSPARPPTATAGPSATQTQAIKVSYPGVRLRCPKGAGRRGCRFTLVAMTKKHGGKAESAVARAKAKAGKRVVVALKAKKAFALRLAKAKNVLVQERSTGRRPDPDPRSSS